MISFLIGSLLIGISIIVLFYVGQIIFVGLFWLVAVIMVIVNKIWNKLKGLIK